MSDISDEMLMARADGQLSPAESSRVDDAMAQDPELRARYEEFVVSRDMLSAMFNQPMHEPVPERLLNTVLGYAPKAAVRPQSSIIERARDGVAAWLFGNMSLSGALAMGAAVVVGVTAGWVARGPQPSQVAGAELITMRDGRVIASGDLQRLLQSEPGGRALSPASTSAVSLKVLTSFKQAGGGFCREFELVTAAAVRQIGLGCKSRESVWNIEAYAPANGGVVVQGPGSIVPAGRATPETVNVAIERKMDGDALSNDAEARAIASGWLGE